MKLPKDCLSCKRWNKCKDSNKGAGYVCSKYKQTPQLINASIFDADENDVDDFSKYDSPKEAQRLDEIVNRILGEPSPVPKDLKIDDSSIPAMANFYEFCFDETYGLEGITPFARQLWIGLKLFNEICPRCTKAKYFDNIDSVPVNLKWHRFKQKFTLLEHGVCPKCNARKSELYKNGEIEIYTELAHCSGMRSGKSLEVSFYNAYFLSKMLKLQKPAELFTGVSNQYLSLTFVSLTLTKTMKLLWTPFVLALDSSKWFQQYHSLLADYNKQYKSEGKEIFRRMDTFIDYRHRKILVAPAAAHGGKLRGETRCGGSIDEIAYFSGDDDDVTISADGIWEALDASMLTMRGMAYNLLKEGWDDIPQAIQFNISSPRDQNDKIMRLIAKPIKGLLSVHTATWEINPKWRRNHPEIKKAYEVNAVAAEKNYGANPPLSGSPFFDNPARIEKHFNGIKNRLTYDYAHKRDSGDSLLSRYGTISNLNASNHSYTSVLALDGGATNNSLAAALGHKEDKQFVIDVLLEIIPEKGKHIINYPKVFEEIINPLVKEFYVTAILADRWNSLFFLQKTKEDYKHVQSAKTISVKYADFLNFQSYYEGGRFVLPKLEMPAEKCIRIEDEYPHCFDYKPASHLFHQFLTVQDTGKTVTKGSHRTDDLFRALVLFSAFVLDEKNESHLRPRSNKRSGGLISTDLSVNSGIRTSTGKGVISGG